MFELNRLGQFETISMISDRAPTFFWFVTFYYKEESTVVGYCSFLKDVKWSYVSPSDNFSV